MELQQREKNNPKADKSRAMKTGHLYVLRTRRAFNSQAAPICWPKLINESGILSRKVEIRIVTSLHQVIRDAAFLRDRHPWRVVPAHKPRSRQRRPAKQLPQRRSQDRGDAPRKAGKSSSG